jgi:hypothetical protein
MYRNAPDFCKLILYPATLLKLFMVSRSFRVEFFGSLRYRIISSPNRDTLTISLPIVFLSLLLLEPYTVARNSRTILIEVWRVDILVSFLTIGEMVSVFPH